MRMVKSIKIINKITGGCPPKQIKTVDNNKTDPGKSLRPLPNNKSQNNKSQNFDIIRYCK